MKENINQVLLLLGIMAVATGTTAVINFMQGNVLQGASDVLMLCSFFILAGVLVQQKFQLDVLKVIGKSHFDLVEKLKKGVIIKKDKDEYVNEEVEITEKEMTEDEKRLKRMAEEYDQLVGRYERLTKFLATDKFKTLPKKSCTLLEKQHAAMSEYIEALKQRIQLECDLINNKKD